MVDFEADFVRHYCDGMARPSWNKVHLRKGFTPATAKTTLDICYFLWSKGYLFACEVKMLNGHRADILVPTLYGSQVIEVMDSETAFSVKKKIIDYDTIGVSILFVPADTEDAILLIKKTNGLL